jgi:hypothetical protein
VFFYTVDVVNPQSLSMAKPVCFGVLFAASLCLFLLSPCSRSAQEDAERNKKIVLDLLRRPENQFCADCGAKGVDLWAELYSRFAD